jgi:hypothetical protein
MAYEGGVDLAKQGKRSMLERERMQHAHVARQRETLRDLVGNLRALSDSLEGLSEFSRSCPLPVHCMETKS